MKVLKFIMLIIALQTIFIECTNLHKNKTGHKSLKNKTLIQKEDYLNKIRKKINYADSILSSRNFKRIKVIVELANGKYVEVIDTSKWPNSIRKTFNIVYDNQQPILFKEVNPGISGDYLITNTYYFGRNGSTIAFNELTSFFNSGCTNNEPLNESKTFYFDSTFRLINKTYRLFDSNNISVDSSNCIFNYRFKYKILKTFSEVIKNIPINL